MEAGDWFGIVVPVNPGGVELGVGGVNVRRVVRGVLRVVWVWLLRRVVKLGVVAFSGGGVA